MNADYVDLPVPGEYWPDDLGNVHYVNLQHTTPHRGDAMTTDNDHHKANRQQIEANTLRQQAETVRLLIDCGFDKVTAVRAVTGSDLSALVEYREGP